jgi:endogenous inhibitor of DNA gyrase (YacG/DUF329 family)
MEDRLWIQDGKSKRSAEKATCEYCKKEFLRRIKNKNPVRFCSKKCWYTTITDPIIVKCHFCGIEVVRNKSKLRDNKSGICFCSRKCRGKAISLDGGNCKELMPNHYGTSSAPSYRHKCKEKILKGCVGCGEKRNFLLLIHHIDGDRQNAKNDNLECVCANCHMIRHLTFRDGIWEYKSNSMTPLEKIKDLQISKE